MGTEDGTSDADKNESDERVQCLKGEALNGGVAIGDLNCVAEEGQHLKSEARDNGVAIADRNGVAGEGRLLKNEAFSNGVTVADKGDSGGGKRLRTYKRRKKPKSKGKVQKQCRKSVETAIHKADKVVKKPCDVALGNTSDDCSHGQWRNIVLKHLYQSLGDGNGGIEGCIREALIHHPKLTCATTVTETFKIDKGGHRTGNETNRHADVMRNGCSSESPGHGVTEMCQHVLSNIFASEKFSSLCKVLLENFQGMKPESVLDFNVMNTRMKEQAYEQSPTVFLSDIQQVWRKLQDTGNEIVALAKSLSNMSKTSYSELLYNREFDSHMKPEATKQCVMYKTCSCSCCGQKVDGTDYLVCDSCEEIYHLSCIEPAVKEIPLKSWYCGSCTANGFNGSPHENCVLCERLNDGKTLNNVIGDGNFPTIVETQNEFEENSNCTYDGIQISVGEEKAPSCRICRNEVNGGKIMICGHQFCSNKHYHARCLTNKQLMSYSHCWYCPSCLCQVCLTDRDDDQIVLCDGCDDAYHIYCMKPKLTSIPSGKWFCRKCDAGIKAIRKAKEAYEGNKRRRTGEDDSKSIANLEKKHNNKRARELERGGAMEMLLTAANTLNFEESRGGSPDRA